MKFWVLTGSLENWDRGISDSIWGCREGLKERWNKLEKGDILVFYVSFPISGIIGMGKVTSKFEASSPLWPDEVRENKIIYPYRFEFKVDYVLPKPEWKEKCIKIRGLNVPFQAGLNSFTNKDTIKTLFEKIDSRWDTRLGEKVEIEAPKPVEEKPVNLHDEIKKKLKEIGEIRGFISENEFGVDGQRLDCVWRSAGVSGAVPKYAFEVQVGGSVSDALGKLKHAYDKWNSNIFLILDEKDRAKANQLLSGTFHEIKDMLKIIATDKIKEFYESQKAEQKLREEIGL